MDNNPSVINVANTAAITGNDVGIALNGAAVVNIGRGNAIDEHALADALASGKIAAAYLDVFKDEPTQLNPGGPSRQGILANPPPNLIAMPHSSAFSPEYVRAAIKELKDDGCI